MKNIFYFFAVIGIIIICLLSFVIPNNPYEIIPAISLTSVDKPLWLNFIILFGSIYLFLLYTVYDKLKNRKLS